MCFGLVCCRNRWADPAFLQAREESLSLWLNESALASLSTTSTSPRSLELQKSYVQELHRFISM